MVLIALIRLTKNTALLGMFALVPKFYLQTSRRKCMDDC